MAINIDDLISSVVSGTDSSTTVTVASGSAASGKAGSGF